MSTNTLRSVVSEAVSSLIKHYSDPIHYSSTTDDYTIDDISSNNAKYVDNNNETYFATKLFDKPMPNLTPVCEFWYKKLTDNNMNTSCDHKTQSTSAAQELICCYESTIHPLIIQGNKPLEDNNTSSGLIKEVVDSNKVPLNAVIEVVKQYELLLAHLMRDASAKSTVEDEMNNQSSNMVEVIPDSTTASNTNAMIVEVDDEGMSKPSANGSNICRMVHIIAEDIFHLSSKLPKNGISLWKVQNILLPCLLRLIQHSIVLLDSYYHYHNNGSSSLSKSKEIKEAYAIATITAVPFVGEGKLNSGIFGIGSLLEWILEKNNDNGTPIPSELSLAYTLQKCVPSPVSKEKESSNAYLPPSIMTSNFMTRSVVDWSVKAAHFDAPWVSSLVLLFAYIFLLTTLTHNHLLLKTDNVSGIGARVAISLLQTVQSCSLGGTSSSIVEVDEIADKSCPTSLRPILRNISQNIGIDLLSSTIRAHFFGRLSLSSTRSDSDANTAITQHNKPKSGAFMPMIQRIGSSNVKKEVPSSDEKPHLEIPMRLSAAAIILCAIVPQSCVDFKTTNKALSDTLPIALSLLDDVQTIHQAAGALLLISAIEIAPKLEQIPSFVGQFSPIVTSSLTDSIQMCGREAPALLTMICLAQSKWMNYCGVYSNQPNTFTSHSQVHEMVCKAAATILVAIGKQVHVSGRDGNDERITGVLVAGSNPLLAQLAHLPNARSIEIARVGLATLLPLISWSGMSLEVRSAQVSALASLVSLMTGAYPIMPKHGKKIMTEVFLLLDRSDKDALYLNNNKVSLDDKVSTDTTSKVAVYTAAVALAICGKNAEGILDHVVSTQSSKDQLKRCKEIRALSQELLNDH